MGNSAITRSDVVQEYRLEAFLDQGRIPGAPPDAAAFERARTRLVSQELLEQEMGAYPANPKNLRRSAEKQLAAVRKKFKSDSDFETALHTLGMSEDQLLKRLEDQQHVLAMIDERMRPSATVTSEDVQQYYHKTFLPQYQASHPGAAPSLDQVEDQIQEILVEKKINDLLGEWLSQMKAEQHVRIIPEPDD
ncbi:MAG TPA: hypothetical protein VFZ08_04760 [Terriglobia bacterium]|nr:hypothetical protein [Terriglobia bacterium]